MDDLAKKEKNFEHLYQELSNLPENVVGEILDGELIVSPRPSPKHASASSAIGGKLFDPYQSGKRGPGGWWILDEPEVHLKGHVFVPDIAGWKKERLPNLPETPYFEITPDWVCEVISPQTARYDRVVKMNLYAQFKIPYYWIVDPIMKTLETYGLEINRWVLLNTFGQSDQVKALPFVEIEFDLSDLWSD